MKKLLSLLLVSIVLLTGCGAASGKSADTSSDEGFKMVMVNDDADGNAMNKAVDRYTEETGVPIEVIEVPSSDYVTKVTNMIAAGDAPALVRGSEWRAISENLVPLDDVVPDGTIVENAVGKASNPSTGELYGLPTDLTAVGLIANKDLLDEYGIEIPDDNDPWTWDEFNEILLSLKGKEDVAYPIVVDKSTQRLDTMIRQFGGLMYSEDGEAITIGDDEAVAAMQNFVNLFDNGLSPESTWVAGEDPQSMFKAGEIPFHYSGNWVYSDYVNSVDFNFVSIPLPYEKVQSTAIGGKYLSVLDTEKQEQAKDFIKWFIEPDNYAQYVIDGSFLPALTVSDIDYGNEDMQKFMDTFSTMIDNSDPTAINNGNNVSALLGVDPTPILRDNIIQAIQGNMTVDEAMEKTADEYSELTGMPKE